MVSVTFGEGSGVNSFIMNYFRHIDHNRVHVDILTYKESPSGKSPYEYEIEAFGGTVYRLPSIIHLRDHLKKIQYILQSGNYDIIHDNSLIVTIPLMLLCKKQKIKVRILHSHATKLGETKAKEIRNRIMLPLLKYSCNHFCACSNAAGKAMFNKRKYVVIPNVIDHKEYYFNYDSRLEYRMKNQITDKIVIISVGRICEQKNPFFAIQVIAQLRKKCPQIIYWWVGDGPLMPELVAKAKEHKIEDITVFWGKQSNVRELYEASDIFFLPSIFEGLPLTGVESQVMGLPSVVSDAVTSEMVFTDLVDFVPLRASIDIWVETLEHQIKRIKDRRSYIPELLESSFSIANAGTRLEKVYEDFRGK